MRINEEFKKPGYFWLPSTPDHKVPGVLQISDGGKVELEIFGILENEKNPVHAFNNQTPPELINGEVESHGYITLENCYYTNKSFDLSGGISKSRINASRAILGAAFDRSEEILVDALKFSIEGLSEWVGISGFTSSFDFESGSVQIQYRLPEEISFDINQNLKLKIRFSYKIPSISGEKSIKIEQETFFELFSGEAIALDDLLNLAFKITTFIGFGVNANVALHSVSATSKDIAQHMGERKLLIPITIIYASKPFEKNPPRIEGRRMLFNFEAVRSNFEAVLRKWLAAYENIDPSLNLYFSVTNGDQKYIENKFLALAQCLETYHRRTSPEKLMNEDQFNRLVEDIKENCPKEHLEWLSGRIQHGNELSLSRRIKKIIEPFKELVGNSGERGKIIRNIVNTRNYLTHYSKDLEVDAVGGIDLFIICKKMEAIFQLHLLNALGFGKKEVVEIYQRSDDLKKKLSSD